MLLLQTSSALSSAALAGLIAIHLAACARPTPLPLEFAPAAMNPSGKYTASPEGSVTFWGNGSLHLGLYLDRGPVEILIEARGHVVAGEAPRLEVRLDGKPAGSVVVASQDLSTYVVSAESASGAETAVDLVFSNHVALGDPLAGRLLHVRRVSVKPA